MGAAFLLPAFLWRTAPSTGSKADGRPLRDKVSQSSSRSVRRVSRPVPLTSSTTMGTARAAAPAAGPAPRSRSRCARPGFGWRSSAARRTRPGRSWRTKSPTSRPVWCAGRRALPDAASTVMFTARFFRWSMRMSASRAHTARSWWARLWAERRYGLPSSASAPARRGWYGGRRAAIPGRRQITSSSGPPRSTRS